MAPSKEIAPKIAENNDGSITIQYVPNVSGVHEFSLSYNEQPAKGSPFRYHVDASSDGKKFVTAYGAGLSVGQSGETASFVVVGAAKDTKIDINGPSKADITKREEIGNKTLVEYIPMAPGEFTISIMNHGKHIHGSPFSAKISGEGRKRVQLSSPATSELSLGGQKVDLTNMIGVVKTPSGAEEPCILKRMNDGSLGIASFQPKASGTYTVEVTQDGSKVAGSPFKINVPDSKIANGRKVKVAGCGMKDAKAQAWNDVNLNLTDAGYGALGVSIEGPHRSDLEMKNNGNEYTLQYRPHEPGIYLLNIRFADDHVTGSPFVIQASGSPSGRVRETFTKEIAEAPLSAPGSKCEFQLSIPGTDPLDMEASLTSPSGQTEMCEIADLPNSLYDIKFVPTENGVHTVSLKHKGLHLSGSPFQYTVGSIPSSGPYKVEIGGTGLERGEVNIHNMFNIYTREAGAGSLSVAVEGPSRAELDVTDRGHGYTTVSYKVNAPGEYGIHVKYNDEHVPDSPAIVYIIPDRGDAKKVTLQAFRDRGLDVDKPATFNVNLNGANGKLLAHCDTPSGTTDDVFVQEMDRELHALRFIPRENGIHYIHIKLDEAHIPGSPFPMLVGKMGADPALVIAKGDGLERGETGKTAKFVVITTNAGSGVLNCQIEGPSKCAIRCVEVDEGYEFHYTPMAPGDYLITVKYCNVTIAGMPCKSHVVGSLSLRRDSLLGTGKPSDIRETSGLFVETVEKKPGATVQKRFKGDASKVVAKGNGLKKTFANRMSNFTVDVKDAGNALLMVGLITPTGNPVEELNYKKQRGTVYQVNYKTCERGEHTLTIRWGSDDIPGSPFAISVN